MLLVCIGSDLSAACPDRGTEETPHQGWITKTDE